jgi:hypothetical protein
MKKQTAGWQPIREKAKIGTCSLSIYLAGFRGHGIGKNNAKFCRYVKNFKELSSCAMLPHYNLPTIAVIEIFGITKLKEYCNRADPIMCIVQRCSVSQLVARCAIVHCIWQSPVRISTRRPSGKGSQG